MKETNNAKNNQRNLKYFQWNKKSKCIQETRQDSVKKKNPDTKK